MKTILPNMTCRRALLELNIEPLEVRQKELTLKFAKNARDHPKLKKLFDRNAKFIDMKIRNPQTLKTHSNTKRFDNSPIVYMHRLLKELG